MFLVFFFFFSLFCLIFLYNVHYLTILLSLEAVLLMLFLFLLFNFVHVVGFALSLLFFLTSVCMGGFSISFLVSLSRSFGRDFWFGGSVL